MGVISFSSLQARFDLPASEYEHYTLIRSFFANHFSLSAHVLNRIFERVCLSYSRDKGLISRFYQYLNDSALLDKSEPMLRWEAELDCSLPVETWHDMADNLRKCNRAISFRENCFPDGI